MRIPEGFVLDEEENHPRGKGGGWMFLDKTEKFGLNSPFFFSPTTKSNQHILGTSLLENLGERFKKTNNTNQVLVEQ